MPKPLLGAASVQVFAQLHGAAPGEPDVATVDQDPPLTRDFLAEDQLEQRGLACPARSPQEGEVAWPDMKADVVETQLTAGVTQRDAKEPDHSTVNLTALTSRHR